jgi:hypothetical protein
MQLPAKVQDALVLTAEIRDELLEGGGQALILAVEANAALTELAQALDPDWQG